MYRRDIAKIFNDDAIQALKELQRYCSEEHIEVIQSFIDDLNICADIWNELTDWLHINYSFLFDDEGMCIGVLYNL